MDADISDAGLLGIHSHFNILPDGLSFRLAFNGEKRRKLVPNALDGLHSALEASRAPTESRYAPLFFNARTETGERRKLPRPFRTAWDAVRC